MAPNQRTGRSIVYDLSGTAEIDYYRDGAFHRLLVEHGHFGAEVTKGNVPEGLYRFGGTGTAAIRHRDGYTRIELGQHGTAQNICFDLSVGHHG